MWLLPFMVILLVAHVVLYGLTLYYAKRSESLLNEAKAWHTSAEMTWGECQGILKRAEELHDDTARLLGKPVPMVHCPKAGKDVPSRECGKCKGGC